MVEQSRMGNSDISGSSCSMNGINMTEEGSRILAKMTVTQEMVNYANSFKYPYMSDVSKYRKLEKIGQGTFGEVFRGQCRETRRFVAMKKILMENEKEGFPITALREVKMLQSLKHKHITELLEICSSRSSCDNQGRYTFYLVFTFCDHDLAGLLSNKNVKLSLVHCKTLMKHLLEGLYQIHFARILHRDMKAANVLITKDGILKLADFGLARPLLTQIPNQPQKCYTNRVVTLWYRPPELLLGERQYGPQIDMWGAGCIMAELWTRTPILQGDSEQRQLALITSLCGSINPESWPGVENLPLYGKLDFPQDNRRQVIDKIGQFVLDELALHLIDSLLSLNPTARPSAEHALDHQFFFSEPFPAADVRDLVNRIKGSFFEYTSGRGAHAARGRICHNVVQRPLRRASKADTNHLMDMVF